MVLQFVANGPENGVPVVTTSGRVLDPSGAPVSGARISVLPVNGAGSDLTSDADGKYKIVWVKHNLWANTAIPFIFAVEAERHLAVAQDLDENSTNLDLRLGAALTLSVKVREADGKPIRAASPNMYIYAGSSYFPFGGMNAANDLGLIEIKDLPQGRHYVVFVRAEGYGSTQIEAKAEETKTNHFEFPPVIFKLADRKLAGQVLDANGKPIARATVSFNGTGQVNAQTFTDDTGHFAFDKVHEGPVQLYASIPTVSGRYMNSSAQANGGDTNVVIRLGSLFAARFLMRLASRRSGCRSGCGGMPGTAVK